jgi:membrane-bound lytic murein transglycosylase A
MKKSFYFSILVILFVSSCQHEIKKDEIKISGGPVCRDDEMIGCVKREAKTYVNITKIDEKDFPEFEFDWNGDLEKAFNLNIKYLKSLSSTGPTCNFGDRKITPELLLKSTEMLRDIIKSSRNDAEFNRALKEKFELYELRNGTNSVVFSSYYEPVFDASLKKDDVFKYPLYRRPDDMIDVNLENFDSDKYKGQKITGRLESNKLVPYYTREQIDFDGILNNRGYEIAYMKDIADLLDIHTEGSGVLKMKEGGYKRARFAATNSLKFKGWMTALLEGGYLKRDGGVGEDKTFYERSKKFINEHTELQRKIIGQNKRYVFFSLDDLKSMDDGPIGTYGSNLVGGRSIAVDNSIIPMGTPAFINVNLPVVDDGLNITSFEN